MNQMRSTSQRRCVAVRALLANINKVCHLSQILHRVNERLFFRTTSAQISQKLFIRLIKMILDCSLIRATDNDDIFNASLNQFLDDVLNNRLINQRQHLLWHGFGLRQKSRTKTGSGDDSFSWFSHISAPIPYYFQQF